MGREEHELPWNSLAHSTAPERFSRLEISDLLMNLIETSLLLKAFSAPLFSSYNLKFRNSVRRTQGIMINYITLVNKEIISDVSKILELEDQRMQEGGAFAEVFIQVTIRGVQSFQALTCAQSSLHKYIQPETTASSQRCLKCPISLFNMRFVLQFNPFICKEFDIALLERLALPPASAPPRELQTLGSSYTSPQSLCNLQQLYFTKNPAASN